MLAKLLQMLLPHFLSLFLDCKHQGKPMSESLKSLPWRLCFDLFLGSCKYQLTVMCQLCRKNLNTALYANSLIGVGIASSLYHTSRGGIRKYLRWADYTMIATSTLVSGIFSQDDCWSRIHATLYACPFWNNHEKLSFRIYQYQSVLSCSKSVACTFKFLCVRSVLYTLLHGLKHFVVMY